MHDLGHHWHIPYTSLQYETTRKSQVEQTMQLQLAHEADAYFLLGDFNMRDIDNETNDQLEEAYVDLWLATHGPIDPSSRGGSYTFDLSTNATAKCISDKVTAIKKTVGTDLLLLFPYIP